VTARDEESGETLTIPARIVVNATGVFTDSIRRMADAAAEQLVVTSQGIHLVFDRSFLKGDTALMVPRTPDGRVLFVIPWHGHAVAALRTHARTRPVWNRVRSTKESNSFSKQRDAI